MHFMKRIYTRSGDKGTTAIHGGARVPKTDIRIEANGDLDELNVAIGSVRCALPLDHEWQNPLKDIQILMMSLMSQVATPNEKRALNPNSLPDDSVDLIERLIDETTLKCDESEYFILPGGSPLASLFHQCRVVARRAERRLWQLNDVDPVPELILRYINRLSDLFFVMARVESIQGHIGEERWKQFAYNRKKHKRDE